MHKVFIGYSGSSKECVPSIQEIVSIISNKLKNQYEVHHMENMGDDTVMSGDFYDKSCKAVMECDIYLPVITSDISDKSVVRNELEVAKQREKKIVPFEIGQVNITKRFQYNTCSCTQCPDKTVKEENYEALIKKLRSASEELKRKGPAVLSEQIRVYPEENIIRRKDLEEKIKEVFDYSNYVILYGERGIGKKALAEKFCSEYYNEKSYKVNASQGIKRAIINTAFKNINYYETEEDAFELKLDSLKNFDENTVIIFEACDTAINSQELNLLKEHKCKYIITTAFDNRNLGNQIEVGPLSAEELTDFAHTFQNLCNENNQELCRLFDILHYHTYSVRLALSIIDACYEDGVKEFIDTNGTLFECNEFDKNSNKTPGECLQELYGLTQMDEDENKVAFFLSHIDPYTGATSKEITEFAGLKDRNPIISLQNKCCIIRREVSGKSVPCLNEMLSDTIYKKAKGSPDFKGMCTDILDNFIEKLLSDDKFDFDVLLKEKSLILYIIRNRKDSVSKDNLGKLYLRLIRIYRYFDMFSEIREILREIKEEDNFDIYVSLKERIDAEEAFLLYIENKWQPHSSNKYAGLSEKFLDDNPLIKMDYARSYDSCKDHLNDEVYNTVLRLYNESIKEIEEKTPDDRFNILECQKRIIDIKRIHRKDSPESKDEIERIIEGFKDIINGNKKDVRVINLLKSYSTAGLYYRNLARKDCDKKEEYALAAIEKFEMGICLREEYTNNCINYDGYADCLRNIAECYNFYRKPDIKSSLDTAMDYFVKALNEYLVIYKNKSDTPKIKRCIKAMLDSCGYHWIGKSERLDYVKTVIASIKCDDKTIEDLKAVAEAENGK